MVKHGWKYEMRLKKINADYTMYEFTTAYVFDALQMSDNLEIELKTPFGHLNSDTIAALSKYNIEVVLLKKSDRGCVYKITRRIEGDDEG